MEINKQTDEDTSSSCIRIRKVNNKINNINKVNIYIQ